MDQELGLHEKTAEHSTDNLHVKTEVFPGCQVKMQVSVTPLACQASYKKAIKLINKEVSIPGFRKGKAPEGYIIQNYASYIDREWRNLVLQTAFGEALNLCKQYPLNEQSVKKPQIQQISLESGAELVFEFESFPQIPNVEEGQYTLSRIEPKPVTEEQIHDAIQDVLLQRAEWVTIEDRGVEEGDYVNLDIEDLERPGTLLCRDHRFEVAKDKMGTWLLALVLGKRTGESVTGTSEPSPDLDPSISFKPTSCLVTVLSIHQATLPALDDAFAQKTGADNVQQFKERMIESLHNQAQAAVQEKYREQMREQVVQHHSFDIPASMVQEELGNRKRMKEMALRQAGKTSEEISTELSETHEEMMKTTMNALRFFLITQTVSKRHQIDVKEGELLREMLYSSYFSGGESFARENMDGIRSKAYLDLLSRKVTDFLIEKATIQ